MDVGFATKVRTTEPLLMGERIRRRRLETGTFVRLGEVEFRFESDVPRLRST